MLFVFLFAAFLSFVSPVMANDDVDWKKNNTSGLYKKGDDDLIARDIWKKYMQDDALETLDNYPHSLHSPSYRSVIQKILLADSKPLKDDEIETPDLLSKRLEMLIQYGLFNDAETLYQSIDAGARQKDFGLALAGLQLTLKNGDLAPACLDIQAATTQFRDMPAWRELARYCKLRFGANEKLDAQSLSFDHYKTFNAMLSESLRRVSSQLSPMETLVAFADDQISRSSYENAARAIAKQSDLFIKLALNKKFKTFETQQCFVIESAARGLITQDDLVKHYKNVPFKEDDLTGKNQAIKIHPCKVPAFFYQRFEKQGDDAITNDDVALLLEATSSVSPHALVPFSSYLTKIDSTSPYLWRAGIIMALSGVEIPNHEGLEPLMAIQKPNQMTKKDAQIWFESAQKSEWFENFNLDPALPFYYLRILSGDFSKFDRKKDFFNYENIFALTYGEKSLHSGLGKIDAMSVALRNDDPVRLFMLALSQANSKPNRIHPEEIAGILSSLRKYKLKKEKDVLAIDALHR